MNKNVTITINGVAYEKSVPLRMLLVDFIRDEAGLTGTHIKLGSFGLAVLLYMASLVLKISSA